MEEFQFIWMLVPICAGLLYTMSGHFQGWFKAWRNHEEHSFDFKKMSKNAIVGVILGIVFIVIQPVSGGLFGEEFAIPEITNFVQFAAGVVAAMGPIVLIDKWLLALKG